MEKSRFFRWACRTVAPGDWRALFFKLARHMPGLGGLATFDQLELEDALELAALLKADLEREAAAWGRAGKK